MGKKHEDGATRATARLQTGKPRNSRSSPVKVERVGGGYNIQLNASALSEACLASCETLKALPAPEGPYTDYDLGIIEEVLQLAHASVQQEYAAGRGSNAVTLVKVLSAYDVVLPNHGIVPSEDVHYYRALLKLSLDPNPDWFAKMQQLRSEQGRITSRHNIRKSTGHNAGALAATAGSTAKTQQSASAAAAACRGPKQHQQQQLPTDAKAHVAVPSVVKSQQAAHEGSALGSLPAIDAAAAAVEAASAAVAAALAEAGVVLPETSEVCPAAPSQNRQQQKQRAADRWYDVSQDIPTQPYNSAHSSLPAGAGALQAEDSWSKLLAAVEAVEEARASPQPRNLANSCSPSGRSPMRQRARSLSPAPAAAAVGTAVTSTSVSTRQRSRSASPHSRSSPGGRVNSTSGYKSRNSAVHEWHMPGSPRAANFTGQFQAPTAVIADSWSPAAHNADLRASAESLDVPVVRPHQIRPTSPWKAEAAAHYLSDLALDQYVRFSRRMSNQQNWHQKQLAAQESRDLQVAAEHRWRLAMSFWEVHCAWRYFRRWRSWAALSAEESSASYRHWLQLCSFRWWMAMVQHYRRQRQQQPQLLAGAAAADAAAAAVSIDSTHWPSQLDPPQQDAGRPCSPLTGVHRLLQQQPHMRPPTSTAAALRHLPSGKVVVGCVFTAWLQLIQQRREAAHVQSLLAWHHIQHVQAGVWDKWRVAFENQNPYHKLMRVVYQGRRHSTLRRVVNHWRVWAPNKRARRRKLRDMHTQLVSNKRSRLWQALRNYTAKRRNIRQSKAVALHHFRVVALHKHLRQWAHILDIKDAFEQLANNSEDSMMHRKASRMVKWWRQWTQLQQQKHDREDSSWEYMAAYRMLRCIAGWQGLIVRRQQLEQLEDMCRHVSALAAGRTTFKAWRGVADLRKRQKQTMLMIITNGFRRQMVSAWDIWTAYVKRRQQQQQDLLELTELNMQRIWQQSFTAWRSALHDKHHFARAVEIITKQMLRRTVQHWKAWVDQKVDWRNYAAVGAQQVLRIRLRLLLQQWTSLAAHRSLLRDLLAGALQVRLRKQLQQTFGAWHDYLARRVAKRMNQLSALLHWEQKLLRKGMTVWEQRTGVWRYKRLRRLRADSYHALRLMDLALTSWTSLWVEGQEMKQKAAFYIVGLQTELKVQMLRAWKEEAAWIRLKRERLEIARLHSIVARQQQVITAWHQEAARRSQLRSLLTTCIQRWTHMAVARAFEQWKDWALDKAALHRKARAVMALLAGRTQQWAFSMLREHALRKRRTRSARHYRQQHLARSVVTAWRRQATDATAFREVLVSVGFRMTQGLLSEAFGGWRDVVRAKQWTEAVMLRALVQWGGNCKKLCFQAWRQWTAIKQGRKQSVQRALNHWQHLYLQQSFGWWRGYTVHKQVAAAVLEHFRLRRLWLLLSAWRAFVANSIQQRQEKSRAHTYWRRRLQAVCLFAWQQYAAYRVHKQQQTALAWRHWRRRKRATVFRAWKQLTEVQLYRRHMVEVVGGKLTNALQLRALNAWRDLVLAKELQRGRAAVAYAHWRRHELIKAFVLWREETREAIITSRVLSHWQQRLLSQAFRRWHEVVLLKQQRGALLDVASSKQCRRLLVRAWTAWREVIDQRHQVANRLHGVHTRLLKSQRASILDAWREVVLLRQLARMALAKRYAKIRQSCLQGWRAVAAKRHATADKIQSFRARSMHQLAVSILQEWAELAWELPRVRKALPFADKWLQQRALWAWFEWVSLRMRWLQLESDVASHWCNLHLAAAWRAWHDWLQQRKLKQQQVETVSRRWCNLHLAAAFQTWYGWLHETKYHHFVGQTIAGRWRNLHTAAAFGAWKSFVAQRQASRSAADAAAQRWNNLHLAAAFGAWKDSTQAAAARAAAAEAVAQQRVVDNVALAFFEWQDYTAQQAELHSKAAKLERRKLKEVLQAAFQGWRAAVKWQQTKQLAAEHWQLAVLRSLLQLWKSYAATKGRHKLAALTILSRSELQLQRRTLTAWRHYITYCQRKAAAHEHAVTKLKQYVLQAWAGLAGHISARRSAAVSVVARVSAKIHNQRLADCFAAWQELGERRSAVKEVILSRSVRQLRTCFTAWHEHSQQVAGASQLLRRQLVGTLEGAFTGWRAVAHERAHWHKVTKELAEFISTDATSTTKVAQEAAARWLNWPLSLAFTTWRANTAEALQERHNEYRALKFLYYALTLKALTGFRWAVQEAQVHSAADEHREGAMKRAVIRGWLAAAEHLKDKRHKVMAALYAYTNRLTRKAFNVWIVYSEYKQHKSEQQKRARSYETLARKAAVFRAWLQVTRYLVPLRSNLLQLQRKRHRKMLRQLLAAWRLHTHLCQLLREAVANRVHKTLAATLAGWRQVAVEKSRLRRLQQASTSRVNRLRLSWAARQWRESARELKVLRTKAQLVLSRTLKRRMRAGFSGWKAAAAYQIAKRAMLATAMQYRRRLYLVKAIVSWAVFLEEARRFRLLSDQMLQRRQQQQCKEMLHWWNLIAQDLHHHRVVLDFFRARWIRNEGNFVFWHWREWAHERMLERKAVVTYWNRLMVTAFASWLEYHEDVQWAKAVTYEAAKRTARTMFAWKVAMALIHRKRVLTAAAVELNLQWCVRKAMDSWLRYTYYRHMGHVALHFRIRRLCCVVLEEWLQAAQTCAQERQLCLELTHDFATVTAMSVITDWQHLLVARRFYSRQRLGGCFGFWAYWAPIHRAKNAKWRQVAQQIQAKRQERCFYTWRWYCQVRVLRSVAFQHKQRAVREAVAIGEQVARRKRQELMAATFMAWHVQVKKYRKVAEKLASLLQHNLSTCFKAWRAAAVEARVAWLQAERHAAANILNKLLPAWADTAAELRADRETAETKANRFFRKRACKKVIAGWIEEVLVVREQRGALWQVMVMLLQHERRGLLLDVLQAWQETTQQQVALRSCIASFVNKRRLECLSEYFTIWHQYAAAMRTDGLVIPVAVSTAAKGHAVGSYSALKPAAGYSVVHTLRPASAAGDYFSGREGYLQSPAAATLQGLAPGILPVTGGPGSPVLGFRSAQQDRRLARRLAAMSGAGAEVDPGSDDEGQLFANLPATAAAAAAAERHDRQQALLALSKGFRQRRITLNDDKAQYDDAADAAAAAGGAGHVSPRFDLHSVADSMRLAHEQGLSPWQLPTVRASPEPKPRQTTLKLEELRQYGHQYPYSLPQQQQEHDGVLLQQQQHQGAVGRPGSAGGFRRDYQPLLQQQLAAHEQRLDVQRWQLQQQQQEMHDWQQRQHQHPGSPEASPVRPQRYHQQPDSTAASPVRQQRHHQLPGAPAASPVQQQRQQTPVQRGYQQHKHAWHESPGKNKKWYQDPGGIADTHWQDRRGDILGGLSATTSGISDSDRSTTPSSASALLGSDADAAIEQQQYVREQQALHHNLYGSWALRAWESHISAAADGAGSPQSAAATHAGSSTVGLPAYAGETLAKSLAVLVTPVRIRQQTAGISSPSRASVAGPPAGLAAGVGQPAGGRAQPAVTRSSIASTPARSSVARMSVSSAAGISRLSDGQQLHQRQSIGSIRRSSEAQHGSS